MPILDKSNKEEVKEYINYIRNYENASLMQDIYWGNVKKNWIQECIYLKKDEKIYAAITVRLEKIPLVGTYIAYASRGPVCDIYDMDVLDELVKEFEELFKKYKIFVLKFDPEILYNKELEKKFEKRGYKVLARNISEEKLIQPRYNAILNIKGKTEEEIVKGFSEKTRYNTKKALKNNIEVTYSHNEEDLKEFYEIYRITAKRDKIGYREYEYFKDMLDSFDENILRIYLTKHEGDILSGAITINYGKKVFYLYGASSNEKRNLMPNYIMQLEMIRWAIETKCNFYDFGGLVTLDETHGLYRFKLGFCKQEGVTEFIGEIDKVYRSFSYFLYIKVLPLIRKVKFKINRLKKRIKKEM